MKKNELYASVADSKINDECVFWYNNGPKLLKAFQKYIDNTVSEYGRSRMFDCGLDGAEKMIKKCKKGK